MEYKTVKKIKIYKAGDSIPEDAKFLHSVNCWGFEDTPEVLFYYEITERVASPEKEFYPEASC